MCTFGINQQLARQSDEFTVDAAKYLQIYVRIYRHTYTSKSALLQLFGGDFFERLDVDNSTTRESTALSATQSCTHLTLGKTQYPVNGRIVIGPCRAD